jgi:nucleotide-binding universal stress UspA family protein
MFNHLLVPVDGSDLSDKAMSSGLALAQRLGARVTGFIVEPFAPPPASIGEGYVYGRITKAHDDTVRAHADEVLGRFERLAAEAGVAFQRVSVQASNVEDAIVDAARDHQCDLVVMVTHGRGVFGELLWGSHTKNLMSRTKLPVLVLHG